MPYPSKTDRNAILAVAMELVEKHGVDKLAIRSVAAELGLAPNALYRYFENLAALEAAGIFGETKPASSFEFGMRMWIAAASGQP